MSLSDTFARYQASDALRPYWEFIHMFMVDAATQPNVRRNRVNNQLNKAQMARAFQDFGIDARVVDRLVRLSLTRTQAIEWLKRVQPLLDSMVTTTQEQVVMETVTDTLEQKTDNIVNQEIARLQTVVQRLQDQANELRQQLMACQQTHMYDDAAPELPARDIPVAPPPPPPVIDAVAAVQQTPENINSKQNKAIDELPRQNNALLQQIRAGTSLRQADPKKDTVREVEDDVFSKIKGRRQAVAPGDDDDEYDAWEEEDDELPMGFLIGSSAAFGPPCMACGRIGAAYQCGGCGGTTHYCSQRCQTRDWVIHQHVECHMKKSKSNKGRYRRKRYQ